MSDEEDRRTASLVPTTRGEIVSRSTALVRRGLDLLDASQPSEAATATEDAQDVDDFRKGEDDDARDSLNAQELDELHQIAEQGYAYPQFLLGSVLLGRDDTEAVAWYRKAADQGHVPAQGSLAWMYANGRGVPQDYTQAATWYRKAADQGDRWGQYNLGLMYANGQGVPQNDPQSAAWFRKAADQGDEYAQYRLALMYANGQGVPQDDTEAVAWYRKAADQGHADAQFFLGRDYYFGRGVPPDEMEAVAWYRKAADQGHADAQYTLGFMYADGQGVKDDMQAEALWRKAADQGHAKAQYSLGLMYAREKSLLGGFYFTVEVVPRDYVEAHKWLNLAASRATGEDQKTFANARDTLLEAMTPAQLAEAQQRAADWQAAFDKRQPE